MEIQDMICVGQYIDRFNELTGQSIPCGPIYQSSGLVKHVRSHHPGTESNLSLIPDIISSPDYIGKHPKEPHSIELVKVFSNHIMVCVKLDSDQGYLYVASVFDVSSGKIKNRLSSGRLQKY